MADTATAPGQATIGSVFSLGWHVGELRPLLDGSEPPTAAALPLAEDLPPDARREQLLMQVQTALAKHEGELGVPDEIAVRPADALAAYEAEPSGERLQLLHSTLLGVLSASDFKLGKAYGLGVNLSTTCAPPAADPTAGWYVQERVERTKRDLADLHTALPDHAAMAVLGSVLMWERQASDMAWDEAETLADQGRTWRALLSGDKSATQDLSLPDYVAAARRAVATGRRFSEEILAAVLGLRGKGATKSEEEAPALWTRVALIVLVVLSVGALLLAFFWDEVNTGAAGVLAALSGLGSVGFVKKLWDGMEGMWDQVRQPIVDATLDVFIAAAITQLPERRKVERIEDLRTSIEHDLHPTGLPRRPGPVSESDSDQTRPIPGRP